MSPARSGRRPPCRRAAAHRGEVFALGFTTPGAWRQGSEPAPPAPRPSGPSWRDLALPSPAVRTDEAPAKPVVSVITPPAAPPACVSPSRRYPAFASGGFGAPAFPLHRPRSEEGRVGKEGG